MTRCKVCNKKIHAHKRFGALSCGACGAFFRRSIAERKNYKCYKGNSCEIIENSRYNCRACRLAKCYEAGMFIDNKESGLKRENSPDLCLIKQEPLTSIEESMPIQTNIIILPIQQLLEVPTFIPQYPLLTKLLRGMHTYLESLKFLFFTEKLGKKCEFSQVKLITKSEWYKLQRASIPLILSMLNNFYEPFRFLEYKEKIALLKQFGMKFWFMAKDYHTSKTFPAVNDTRQTVVDNANCYLDYKNSYHVEYFLHEFQNPEEHMKITMHWLQSSREMSNKFISRGITDAGFAALGFIMFLIDCESFSEIKSHVDLQKESLFKELYSYYTSNFGFEQGAIKYANLFYLLDESMSCMRKLHEDLMMAQIFLTDFYDLWVDLEKEIPAFANKLI